MKTFLLPLALAIFSTPQAENPQAAASAKAEAAQAARAKASGPNLDDLKAEYTPDEDGFVWFTPETDAKSITYVPKGAYNNFSPSRIGPRAFVFLTVNKPTGRYGFACIACSAAGEMTRKDFVVVVGNPPPNPPPGPGPNPPSPDADPALTAAVHDAYKADPSPTKSQDMGTLSGAYKKVPAGVNDAAIQTWGQAFTTIHGKVQGALGGKLVPERKAVQAYLNRNLPTVAGQAFDAAGRATAVAVAGKVSASIDAAVVMIRQAEPPRVPAFGWKKDPAAIAAATSKDFSAAAPHLMRAGADDNGDRLFWRAEEYVCGTNLGAWDQGSIGSCVGHGSGRAAQYRLMLQIAAGSLESFPKAPNGAWAQVSREAVYALSRYEVGGDKHDSQDGSLGRWAAGAVKDYGLLFYLPYDESDLTDGYSVSRCKNWGYNGLPDALEPVAKLHPIKAVALVKTADECWAALGSDYPISICGDISRPMKRQAGGICPQTGNDWPHCQCLCGRVTVGGKRYVVYQNSWGDYLGNTNARVKTDAGLEFDLPSGCYLASLTEIVADLSQGDSYAYSDAAGWPATSIDWYVFHRRPGTFWGQQRRLYAALMNPVLTLN